MVERGRTQTGGDISSRSLIIGVVAIAIAIVTALIVLR